MLLFTSRSEMPFCLRFKLLKFSDSSPAAPHAPVGAAAKKISPGLTQTERERRPTNDFTFMLERGKVKQETLSQPDWLAKLFVPKKKRD